MKSPLDRYIYVLISTSGMPKPRGQGGHWPPSQYLADQLTLFKPWGADSAWSLLLAPQNLFTFRRHCQLRIPTYLQLICLYDPTYFEELLFRNWTNQISSRTL